MPLYNASGPCIALYQGDQQSVFVATDAVVAATFSQQVCFPVNTVGVPVKFGVELLFSGAPGAFEVDLQTADTDVDAAYQNYPVSGAITAVDANQRARAEFVNVAARFARLRVKTLTNAVNLTAKITR